MEKHLISTMDCPDGYIIIEDVFNNYGSLIINKNTIVTESIRKKLRIFQVDKIKVSKNRISNDSKGNSSMVK